jgi:hypothetical protein
LKQCLARCSGAKDVEHGSDRAKTLQIDFGSARGVALLGKYQLMRQGPSGAAVLDGPCRRRPATSAQDGRPLRGALAGRVVDDPVAVRQVGGQVRGEKRAHLSSKSLVFGVRAQIHIDSKKKVSRRSTDGHVKAAIYRQHLPRDVGRLVG